jgi:ketosteroid isomerase-like protein
VIPEVTHRGILRGMSQESVDVARAAFEQFARGDFSAFAALPDEFELVLAPEMPDAGIYRGEEARRWLAAWVGSFDRLTQELVDLSEAGNGRLLAEFVQRGWTAGSDVPVELPSWSLATFRDGSLLRMELFMNRDAAAEAAGLP